MPDRQTFAFDDVFTGLRHVKQQIDDVVLKKIYLVNIKVSAIGARKQTRLESLFASRNIAK